MTLCSVLLKALSIYHMSLLNVKKQHVTWQWLFVIVHRAYESYVVSSLHHGLLDVGPHIVK